MMGYVKYYINTMCHLFCLIIKIISKVIDCLPQLLLELPDGLVLVGGHGASWDRLLGSLRPGQ